jgi:peptidoglycan/LPS O-acetylase OafA/YrhL
MGLLRLWFALIVVFEHSNPSFPKWPIIDSDGAVLGFFVLSGFYMAMILDTRYRSDLRSFYFNRVVRLYPTYIVCLFASIAVFAWLAVVEQRPYGPLNALAQARLSPGAWVVSVLSQLSMWGQDFSTYLFAGQDGNLHFAFRSSDHGMSFFNYYYLPQAWTLSVELSFYAIVPFLNRWRTRVLATVFLAGLIVRVTAMSVLSAEDRVGFNRLLPIELSVFCGGMVAWRFVRSNADEALRSRVNAYTAVAVSAMLVLGWLWDATSTRCITVPLAVTLALPSLWLNWGSDRTDRLLGDLSYPVYLCHILICYMLLAWLPADQQRFFSSWALIGSLVAAILLRLGLERPLLRLKRTPLK